MAEDDLPTAATEMVPLIKYTNRRRMAWMAAIQTTVFVAGFTLAGFLWPAGVAVLIPVLPVLIAALNWPQMFYFGVTHLIDRFVARNNAPNQQTSQGGSE